MKFIRMSALGVLACVALSACRLPTFGAPAAPTGQVVATVDGREITMRELQAELGDAQFPDAKTRKAAEQLALRNIIGRVLLADAARAKGLDKTPDFAIASRRAVDTVLMQLLQKKIVGEVPAPSKDEVDTFMAAHPDIFLERKIFAVDQIRMAKPSDPAVIQSLGPLKTMEQVEDALKQHGIAYQRVNATLDTVGLDPRMVDGIVKLPRDEIFVFPTGGALLVNQIRGATVTPFTGEAAANYARSVLLRQRSQETLQRSFSEIMSQARGKVQFNKEFAPEKPTPPPAAPPAGQAPASAPPATPARAP